MPKPIPAYLRNFVDQEWHIIAPGVYAVQEGGRDVALVWEESNSRFAYESGGKSSAGFGSVSAAMIAAENHL